MRTLPVADILQCRSETLLVETTSMTVVLVFLVVSLVSCVFVCCLLFCACSSCAKPEPDRDCLLSFFFFIVFVFSKYAMCLVFTPSSAGAREKRRKPSILFLGCLSVCVLCVGLQGGQANTASGQSASVVVRKPACSPRVVLSMVFGLCLGPRLCFFYVVVEGGKARDHV